MNKGKLNFIIDATMFLCMMAMAGLGFLMRYIMPPGRQLIATLGSNPNTGTGTIGAISTFTWPSSS